MFKLGISAHNIKFQKQNFSYRSSERVIHNERLFEELVTKIQNMTEFIAYNYNVSKYMSNFYLKTG